MEPSRRDIVKLMGLAAAGCPFVASGLAFGAQLSAHEALYWESLSEKRVKCVLCPRECQVADRERGTCGVRENRGGKYYTLVHSRPCALNNDPIEKKPLFHYRPGTKAFSLATAGCNIECRFCQNWEISQFRPEQVSYREMSPGEIVQRARGMGSKAIAFTYSEPVIFYEYMLDICKAAAGSDIGRVIITNGYIEKKPLVELLRHLDAVKIDFKAYSEKFYKDYCSGTLKPVLESLVTVKEAGVWLEMVMLVIPTLNDSTKELRAMAKWIVSNLGVDVPIHFTRFHPMYKIKNLPPTPVRTLEKARQIALDAGIHFAYAGNVPGHPGENTYCSGCGEMVIRRDGYYIDINKIQSGKCFKCHRPVPGVWR